MTEKYEYDHLSPRYCDECGKETYITPDWAYKTRVEARRKPHRMYKMKYFCSYSCLRKFEKKNDKGERTSYGAIAVSQYTTSGVHIADFKSIAKAADAMDTDYDAIFRSLTTGKPIKNGYVFQYQSQEKNFMQNVKEEVNGND